MASLHVDREERRDIADERFFGWLQLGDETYGVSRATLTLAKYLREDGVTARFVSLREGALAEELEREGFEVAYCAPTKRGSVDRKTVERKSGFFRLASMTRDSLVYLNETSRLVKKMIQDTKGMEWLHFRMNSLLPIAGYLDVRWGLKSFWHIPNEINNHLPVGLQPRLYSAFCRIGRITPIPNSIYTGRSLSSAGYTENVVYPGVDCRHFLNDNAARISRQELGIKDGTAIFLIAARLHPAKGQDRVIEAMAKMLREGRDCSLLIVGGPLDSEFGVACQEQVSRLGLDDRVKFFGPSSDPRGFYRLSDVVINSRVHAEPFGQGVVEAMVQSKPVLALARGGTLETIVDGETGWLIRDSSVDGWRAGMNRALSARDKWEAMGQAGAPRALKFFSASASARKYVQIVSATMDMPSLRVWQNEREV